MKEISQLIELKKYEQALDKINGLLKEQPNHSEALFNRAMVYRKKGDYTLSIADLDTLLSLHPNNASVISERAVNKFHMGHKQAALLDMNIAVEIEPTNPYRYASRAYVLGAMNRVDEALKDYQKAIELDPEDVISLNNLGLLEERQGKLKQAQEHFKKADKIIGYTPGSSHVKDPEIDSIPNNLKDEKKSDSTASEGSVNDLSNKVSINYYFKTIYKVLFDRSERKAFFNYLKKAVKK